uniref:Uncharacterized protein n=1 Tax=Clandestinovirus TaxID=2831644 RepID=A0A8F8PK52_9VIRU|nr:hypothetical protein KOM_12_126 [Clandestinovirus]
MEGSESKSVYETHITVDPFDQGLLFAFIKQQSDARMINLRPTCPQTFYGDYPIQPMLTYWYNGQDEDACDLATKTGIKMEQFGMRVNRVKVEAAFSGSTVPDYADGEHYFEFHFKVAVATNAEWNKLANMCALKGAHLSFNLYSKSGNMVPIVTIRLYHTTKQDALTNLQSLVNAIKEDGFTLIGGVEREYSVMDSNVFLDQGWLFKENTKPDSGLFYVPIPL